MSTWVQIPSADVNPSMAAHPYNPSNGEAEIQGSPGPTGRKPSQVDEFQVQWETWSLRVTVCKSALVTINICFVFIVKYPFISEGYFADITVSLNKIIIFFQNLIQDPTTSAENFADSLTELTLYVISSLPLVGFTILLAFGSHLTPVCL